MKFIGSIILITFVIWSFVRSEKKILKGKQVNKTSSATQISSAAKTLSNAKASSFAKTKNGKRWMQTYPSSYIQQQDSIQSTSFNNPYGEQPFGGPPDSLGYGFNGFKDNSFHDIYNLNKQPYGSEDLTSNFGQDENAYLKPGIGDYPSDIQMNSLNNLGGIRPNSYDLMTNVGLPIHDKPKTQRFSQALNTLEQIALDDAALNPTAMHKKPISNIVSGDNANSGDNVLNSNKLESTGTEVKISKEPLSLIKEEGATEGVPAVEAKDDSKVAEVQPKIEAKEDTTDETSTEKTKAKELSKQKVDMSVQKDISLHKDMSLQKEVSNLSSSKEVKSETSLKDTSKNEKDSSTLISSKAKTQNGARRQNWENDLVDISDVGLSSFSSNNIYDKDISENNDLIEDIEKTPFKVKEKLISSLEKASDKDMSTSDKDISTGESKELDEAAKNLALEKGEPIELIEDSIAEEKEASGKTEASDDSFSETDSKTTIIEQNLMKIDKPKLVHLLATFIRDNEMKEEGQNEINESKHLAQKIKEENSLLFKENLHLKALATKLQNAEKSKGLKEFKHGNNPELASSLDHDPYANIGNTDPNNADNKLSLTRKIKKQAHKFSTEDDKGDKKEDESENKKLEALNLEKKLNEEKVALKDEEMKELKLAHLKNLQDTESSGDLKEGKEIEQDNVDIEVQLERQELKKLKALEKAEKEKENELKASYAVMANKNKETAALEETGEDEVKDEEGMNKKISKIQKGHLVSPELVKAIADQLQKHKSENDEDTSQEYSKGDSKEDAKEVADENDVANENEKNNEKLKEDEKSDDESLNVQTLIEHMKQSLINAKKIKNKNVLKQTEKSNKHHKAIYDDAYAQIGSQDINIKRSRKFAKKSVTRLSRDKKHHVHHSHSLKKQ